MADTEPHHVPLIRVACITLNGQTLVAPADQLQEHMDALDDNCGDVLGDEGDAFTLQFKTMLVSEYEALGDFDGF